MSTFTVTHNVRDVDRFATFVFSDQLPFVTARAINDAALAAQKAQRAHQEEVFEVRRPGFVRRAVKIKPFATKERQFARISIDPPGGQSRADILTRHEEDSFRHPLHAGKLAVPTEHVLRTPAGVVRKAERPSSLQRRELAGGGARGRGGRKGTFRRDDTIFERRSDGTIRPLWQLVDATNLDQRLDFVDNVFRVAGDEYERAFPRRFDQAIRTAR